VQLKEDELSLVHTNLRHEKETIRVLSVEWDYLNRPQRLEALAKDQLGMVQPSVSEVVSGIHEIPEPIIPLVKPQLFDEGFAQSVSMEPEAPKAVASEKVNPTLSPSSAEKQNFDKLIQSLDEGAQ